MKTFIGLLLVGCLWSCGVTVNYDYDTQENFKNYATYNFYPSIASGLNELDDKRIIKVTDSLLQLKGFKKSDNPQLLINFYAKEGAVQPRNTIGVGIGGGGRNVGYGISGGIPIGGRTIDQQFTIDIIATTKDQLIWQGITEGAIKEKASPQWKEAYYKKIISKILKGFPPKTNN